MAIPVRVNFSRESPSRPGLVWFEARGDTVVIHQRLERTEQWESDEEQAVYVPRALLQSYVAGYQL